MPLRSTHSDFARRLATLEWFEPRQLMTGNPILDTAGTVDEPTGRGDDVIKMAHITGQNSGAVRYVHDTYGFSGRGQTVAIIDSGIAYDHYALGGGLGSGNRVVGGWDFAETDRYPYDDAPGGFHGTHVAGIIGSADQQYKGLAPQVDFVGLRVFDDQGQGHFGSIEKALRWVHKNKNAFPHPITTVNMSLGSQWNSTSVPSWSQIEDELALLEQDGIFVAVAAGNSFAKYNQAGLSYPASSPHVVPVSSVDAEGQLSDFSQRHHRSLAAPGESVISTAPDYLFDFNGITDDFVSSSGTSMAAPYVAGASVLVREAMAFVGHENVTQDIIYNHLRQHADLVYDADTRATYHVVNLPRSIDTLMSDDDYGSSPADSFDLGYLHDGQLLQGQIGRTDDWDYFEFTASLTGITTIDAVDGLQNLLWRNTDAHIVTANSLTLNVIANQQYYVAVSTADSIGGYTLKFKQTAHAQNLGTIDDYTNSINLQHSGGQWFEFQMARAGFVTVEVTSDRLHDSTIDLYDSGGVRIASTSTIQKTTRLDMHFPVAQGLKLRLRGTSDGLDVRIVNLVATASHDPREIDVFGTSLDDIFSFKAGETYQVSVNRISYEFDADKVHNIRFDGDTGFDSIAIVGTAGNETVTIRSGNLSLIGVGFTIDSQSVENTNVYGNGGDDRANLFGSVGDDQFVGKPRFSWMRGDKYFSRVEDFTHVYAYADTGGIDLAYFYDSDGNERFDARPTYSMMKGIGFLNYATGFKFVYAYATAGGENDVAYFFDSAGNDQFIANPTSAQMRGDNFFAYGAGFDRAQAYSTSGGEDVAIFRDSSGSDQFVGKPTFSWMRGESFLNRADAFDQVYAYAGGENDRAYFYDSFGNDQFVGKTALSWMKGDGFINYANGFDQVYADAKTQNDYDRAYLYDSVGTDALVADDFRTILTGSDYFISTAGFAEQIAHSSLGGNDRSNIVVADSVFRNVGAWSE